MKNVPTEADYQRAKKLARARSRGLDAICRRVNDRFRPTAPLHNVYILPQRDVKFRTYIFWEKVRDLALCERKGVAQEIQDFVWEELERAGLGRRGEISVAFEFDSDENVEANFEGDYLLRLR